MKPSLALQQIDSEHSNQTARISHLSHMSEFLYFVAQPVELSKRMDTLGREFTVKNYLPPISEMFYSKRKEFVPGE